MFGVVVAACRTVRGAATFGAVEMFVDVAANLLHTLVDSHLQLPTHLPKELSQ